MQDAHEGQRLGRLELLRVLGTGGMGQVWLARQDGLERHVAVKILPASHHPQSIDRLRREARALARIRHPHVVPVHDVGEADGFHYYVMDLIDGQSLASVLATRQLAWPRAAEIARQIAEALGAAHDQGVIHRDVKPANVLLSERLDDVTLVDFGVALSDLAPALTSTGDMLGTPHYMAPEQARGEAYLADARTDVWGVGVTLYEMVTGTRPFDGAHLIAVQHAVLECDPVPPRKVRSDCPRDLETVILHCLDKDPGCRYPSARALAHDLARLLSDQPIRARPSSLGDRLGKHVRRHRIAWRVGAGTALVSLVAAVALAVATSAGQRDREAGEAQDLVRAARVFADRGALGDAWSKLREVELRFLGTPAVTDAYWAMAELSQRAQHEDDVLAQAVWLERLLAAGPPPGDRARAHWRLGRIYEKHGFLDDAHDQYAQAVEIGALTTAALDDARFGLRWSSWLAQRVDADVGGLVLGAGDLDGDGRQEVLAHAPGGGLVALGLRGDHLEVVRRWDMPEFDVASNLELRRPALVVADVNGDGRADLGGVAFGHCFVDELDGATRRRVLDFAGCNRLKMGDLDGDGKPELLLLDTGDRVLRMVRVARDWSIESTVLDDLTVEETSVAGIEIADLDGDGRAELIYAGGAWTRYDLRVAQLEHGALRVVARAQLGVIAGVTVADSDGDGRPEIFAVKSHVSPNPRLFDDDPGLGSSGPLVLRLAGDRLERTWSDPLVAASAPATELRLTTGGRPTRLGALFVVADPGSVLHLYVGRPGRDPIRRDLRRLDVANLGDNGAILADLDGDGNSELVLGGPRISAHGIGPARLAEQHRERAHLGTDWLSTARELREAGETELALSAYRAAAAQGADTATVAYEEGLCDARAHRWQAALDRFREARAGGRHDGALLQSLLDSAEAVADWTAALEAARELGSREQVAALEPVLEMKTVFVQNFVDPWPAWSVDQALACRGRTADGAIRLSLLPEDRALDLPIAWDGSSLEASAVVALRDIQYGKGFQIAVSQGDEPWTGGGIRGGGGGGALFLGVYAASGAMLSAGRPAQTAAVDWSGFPERVRLALSYVAAVNEWQMAVYELSGKRLYYTRHHADAPPTPGRYLIHLSGGGGLYLAASIVDLYQFEIRAAPSALTVVDDSAPHAPARCARDLDPMAASSPAQRAFALASAGRIVDAARALADWRSIATAHAYPWGFEFDAYQATQWEAELVRLALLDEPLTSAVVEAGGLMARRDWGVLLRRLAYQQYVDSGQTHWREAIVMLRRATQFAPDDAHGWYLLGYCHYRLEDLADARRSLERAFALDADLEQRYPKQGGPAIFLARIAGRSRDVDAAAHWVDQAARHGGNLDIVRHDRVLRPLLGDRLSWMGAHGG